MPASYAEQATAAVMGTSPLRWLAASPGFAEEWKGLLEPRCLAQSPRPESARGQEAIIVLSLPPQLVAIGRVIEIGESIGVVGFHWLVLHQSEYRAMGGDPFALADACPASWDSRGALPLAALPSPATRRTAEEVCRVLQREDGPMLLGAVQAIVDGGRLAWVREQPAPDLLRALWALLPWSTRAELRPASFAVAEGSRFDVVVVPRAATGQFDKCYLSEEQADNYPEGRYELGVQQAAEAGDEASLDALFARRSRRETWRLGLWIAGAMVVLVMLMLGLKTLTGQ
jgi:hypothetical protein